MISCKNTTTQLPLLEESLAMDAAHHSRNGLSEKEWLSSLSHIAAIRTYESVPNHHVSNRLEQAVINLKVAGLWPWAKAA